jgi:hypothetical protein
MTTRTTNKRTTNKHDWEQFANFKQRGEWVELLFMAAAYLHGFRVLKPWGDSWEYDVGRLIRIQVKSTSVRNGTGYFCQFRRNYLIEKPYSLNELDLFAAYIIPEKVWYIIPASVILTPTIKTAITVCPMTALKKDRYKYEHYREAWDLLKKSRSQLRRYGS